jgi:putative addiction module component (TIGR02574 family)
MLHGSTFVFITIKRSERAGFTKSSGKVLADPPRLPSGLNRDRVCAMTGIEEIQKTVLALPVEQRVRLAESLLSSLPEPVGETSEAAELEEAERRNREIESGQVQPISESEFWHQVEEDRGR